MFPSSIAAVLAQVKRTKHKEDMRKYYRLQGEVLPVLGCLISRHLCRLNAVSAGKMAR